METLIKDIINVAIVSTHSDISTKTGEKIIIITTDKNIEDMIRAIQDDSVNTRQQMGQIDDMIAQIAGAVAQVAAAAQHLNDMAGNLSDLADGLIEAE